MVAGGCDCIDTLPVFISCVELYTIAVPTCWIVQPNTTVVATTHTTIAVPTSWIVPVLVRTGTGTLPAGTVPVQQ